MTQEDIEQTRGHITNQPNQPRPGHNLPPLVLAFPFFDIKGLKLPAESDRYLNLTPLQQGLG